MSSHTFDIVFHRAEAFNFSEVQFIDCCRDCASGTVSKKSSLYPGSPKFSSMLSSKSFIVLCFTFKCMIHFEFIFINDRSLCLNSYIYIFLYCLCCIAFTPLSKITDYINVGLFLCPLFCSIDLSVYYFANATLF